MSQPPPPPHFPLLGTPLFTTLPIPLSPPKKKMLSSDIRRGKDRTHLEAFLQRVYAPVVPPKGTPEEQRFRKRVLKRLELRRQAINAGSRSFEISDRSSGGCCSRMRASCCTKPRCMGGDDEPEFVWRRLDCKTLETFTTFATSLTSSCLAFIRCMKVIWQELSYWEQAASEWEGLSQVGGYMWMITYSLQYLVDTSVDGPKNPVLRDGIHRMKEDYEHIAQCAEVFSEGMEAIHAHVTRLRQEVLLAVKKMLKAWDLTDQSPLQHRPEKPHSKGREPKRRVLPGGVSGGSESDLLQDTGFEIQWSSQSVMICNKHARTPQWFEFSEIPLTAMIDTLQLFLLQTISIVELQAENMTLVATDIESIQYPSNQGEGEPAKKGPVHAREISHALLAYSKSAKKPEGVVDGDILKVLSDLWYSVDILFEEESKVFKLVLETRDIIRTCYVYADVFYKLELPSYDHFLGAQKEKEKTVHAKSNKSGMRKGSSRTSQNIQDFWAQYVEISGTGKERRLSEISGMLVMMDFSSSVYQRILQSQPVDAGDLKLKLNTASGFYEEKEEYGLVSGIKPRKSVKNWWDKEKEQASKQSRL